MISHGKDIKIFCGNSNPALAQEICKFIGTSLGEAEVKHFADGEACVSLYETVRGSDVFLINPTCNPVNDSLMELLVMIDACKRASAGRVTAVIPYFGYARQDRKARSRDPISAKLVANMITAAGADRVLTMDLHAAQIQGFFDIPVDNLLGNPVFVDYYAKKFGEKVENMVVVSPDAGSVARARTFAQKLHMDLAGMQVHGQDAVGAGHGDHVGHQLGGDGIAALGLAVLTGITKVGDDGGDTAGAGAAAGIDHDQQLHQIVIDGLAGGLDQKNVSATDGFFQRNGSFAVSKGLNSAFAHGNPKLVAYGLCEFGVGITAEDLDVVVSVHQYIPHSLSYYSFHGARHGCSLSL